MKHVMLSAAWGFSTEPFPAFRCGLVYGRNQRDRQFLPVAAGAEPVVTYTVEANCGHPHVYVGPSKEEAMAAKQKYHREHPGCFGGDLKSSQPILAEGKFRVIKTREKGTILVVPGEDSTNRCLLMVGCEGGFRGGVSLVESGTTGVILKEAEAGNRCDSSIHVCAILEVGQSVAFHTYGRRTDEVYLYTWNGTEVEKKHFSKAEWDSRNAIASPPTDDAEVL